MSINFKPALFMSILLLLFCFGCATTRPEPVIPQQKAPEPVVPPQPATEPQPVVPEQTEPVKGPEDTVAPSKETTEPRSTVPGTQQADKTAPRAVASLKLTEQARLMIESKRPDEAISVLEKAMNINPGNGQNYYYLAEAWILKGNKAQAVEFNRMAGIYLGTDAGWKTRIRQQKERIEKMNGSR